MKGKMIAMLLAVLSAALLLAADKVQTRISITSQPAGATVVIDGKDRGITPLTLFDLAPGRHHLKFRLAGYVERDRFFTTDEGPFIEKNEVMVEETGLLLIKTDPEDCDIQIDGVSVGRSPRLITNLASRGTYNVKLVKAGYQDSQIVVKFDGRKPLVRDEKLILDSGVIDITSEPAGAEVTVNGVVRGNTPLLVKDVPKGRAVVKFKLGGFQEEVRELALQAGDQLNLPIVLKALPGTLHLTSVPEGARFYLNEEARGSSPIVISSLAPGVYNVRAEKDGFGTLTRSITIENGASAREEFVLTNVMGRLEVRTDPAGATVVFDGRVLGVTKTRGESAASDVFAIENVLEGEHTLIIRKEGFKESVRHPKIQNSKTSQANVRLKRLFVPDVEIVTSSGSYRGILISNTSESVIVEVALGVQRSFKREDVRKVNFLSKPGAKK